MKDDARRLAGVVRFFAMMAIASLIVLTTANAHAIGSNADGFFSGLEHPVFGPDHLLAMFAVGLWGAQMGGRSVWELPVAFPLIITIGGVLGIMSVPLPFAETLILPPNWTRKPNRCHQQEARHC